MFLNVINMNGHTSEPRKPRPPRRCDHLHFDWEKAKQDATKFSAVPCHKEADRIFLLKVLALMQTTIPPWCVWDALEAVNQIGPRTPLAYFRTVLKDNCLKAGVDFDRTLKRVHVPANVPRYRPSRRRSTPLPDDALRLRADELQKAIP